MEKTYRVEMDVSIDVPEAASERDIEQYIAFSVGATCILEQDNAVYRSDSEPVIDVSNFEIFEL